MSAPRFERVFSNAPWEGKVGYCRALRVEGWIFVTGTVAVGEDGEPWAPGDPEAQTRRCLELVERALKGLGAGLEDVVRTRLFVTDIDQWGAIGRAHGAAFACNPPATTMVEVSRLIHPDCLVEVEAVAHATGDARRADEEP
jgi:enamine deaminase RidA (YjgF/YER057c/UK114 family)